MDADEKPIVKQPWYKERLRTKYLKKLKKGESLNAINTKNWVKVRPKMDDFRDGYPPDFDGVYFLQGNKGLTPTVLNNNEKDTFSRRLKNNNLKNTKQRPFLTKEQQVADRKLPLNKMRLDHINEVEFGLTQHPLALYPHLEEGMPPELFDELVDILDPAMNPGESTIDGDFSDSECSVKSSENGEQKQSKSANNSVDDGESNSITSTQDGENPFTWMLDEEERDEFGEKKMKNRTPPPQDEHIKQVTRKFCDWVNDLGGETNNIEESTVMSLFASGYETKPALSVPIHVVELSYIPAELRETAGMPSHDVDKKSRDNSARRTEAGGRRRKQDVGDYEPSWIKTKYGAWYLKPNQWRVMKKGEQLEDPAQIQKREQSESKMKSDAMDSELAQVHGSRAFRNFLERKQRRMPVFMTKVSMMQDIEDEALRKEADMSRNKNNSRATKRSPSSINTHSNMSLA